MFVHKDARGGGEPEVILPPLLGPPMQYSHDPLTMKCNVMCLLSGHMHNSKLVGANQLLSVYTPQLSDDNYQVPL